MVQPDRQSRYLWKVAQVAIIVGAISAGLAYLWPKGLRSGIQSEQKIPVYFYNASYEPCINRSIVIIPPDGGVRIYPNNDGIIYVPVHWLGKEISIRDPKRKFREIQRAKILPNKIGKVVIIVDII